MEKETNPRVGDEKTVYRHASLLREGDLSFLRCNLRTFRVTETKWDYAVVGLGAEMRNVEGERVVEQEREECEFDFNFTYLQRRRRTDIVVSFLRRK
ncbi:hypothetical protein NPIL_195791 [Nephila pilipes]|uniref:Uncharacterized protein n=1 Tax=Nephila pilipes TaxID=299642 RepID=A0A8X6NHP9_NEPPI|nr:hypothetical protein NPIL_195791 [Nephila pilipes]